MVVCEHVDRFMRQPTGPHKNTNTFPTFSIVICGMTLFSDAEHTYRPSSISLPWLGLSMLLCGVSVLCKEQGITILV